EDVFSVELSNDAGVNFMVAEQVGPTGAGTSGGWNEVVLHLQDYLPLTSQMIIRFSASDLGSGSIVEAAIDDVKVSYMLEGDCPPAETYCTTSPNSVGPGVTLATSGTTGVSLGDFTLHASGIPPGNFGLFFYSATQGFNPLGEGTLCISAPFTRLSVLQADAGGAAQHTLAFGGGLAAGSEWNFQFWYRDPSGGPTGFNTSDAVNARFCN
ncbi:MAG: hypothetical protein ACI9F9_002201, partial [Candidatus Paceibacteria bacterium]